MGRCDAALVDGDAVEDRVKGLRVLGFLFVVGVRVDAHLFTVTPLKTASRVTRGGRPATTSTVVLAAALRSSPTSTT